MFADADASILAQRNVRNWIHSENIRLFGPEITPDRKALIEAFVAPTVVYDTASDVYLGSRAIQIRSFPGHTGGDSVVVIPDAKVIFTGDLLFRDMFPTLIDASTQAWIATLDALATNEPDYTFVPGHGGVSTVRDLTALRQYLITLRTRVAEAQAQGKSGDALAEAVIPTLRDKYGHWEYFDVLANEASSRSLPS